MLKESTGCSEIVKMDPIKHHIVFLQAAFCKVPDFQLPPSHSYTKAVYDVTSLADLHARVHSATILVFSAIKIDAVTLSPEVTPYLKYIVIVATGTDCVDLDACRARGILVSNCPNANVESVSEHALGMYFTIRRRMLEMRSLTMRGEWPRRGTLMFDMLDRQGQPPLTCQEEVVGILGYGAVGKRIATIARAVGMKVLISGRKNDANGTSPPGNGNSNGDGNEQRVPFEHIIKTCTVIFIAVPLTDSTRHLISTPELEKMPQQSILVNVSRGGVVDEEALVAALKENRIAGAAMDVFREEPAGPENSPLLAEGTKDLNLLVTPHLAWLAGITWTIQSQILKENIEQ